MKTRNYTVTMTVTFDEEWIKEDLGKDFKTVTMGEIKDHILKSIEDVPFQIDDITLK